MAEGFSDKSEEYLLAKLVQGDLDAFGELCGHYDWLIKLRAGEYCGSTAPEYEDLLQEGYIALFAAARSYNKEIKASFKTYADVCVRNRMITAYRRNNTKGNALLKNSVPLDNDTNLDADFAANPELIFEVKQNVNELTEKIVGSLTKLELRVLNLYLRGIDRNGAFEASGIKQKVYDNALQRVRSKLKDNLQKKI